MSIYLIVWEALTGANKVIFRHFALRHALCPFVLMGPKAEVITNRISCIVRAEQVQLANLKLLKQTGAIKKVSNRGQL